MPTAGAMGIEPSAEARAHDAPPAAAPLASAPPASTPPAAAPPAAAPPDWSTIQETIRCPLCRYDLRGLIEPRCPECGYRFDWSVLLEPARREHPYLFEHHPEKNLGSFARTLIGHLRPSRFWESIQPHQAANVRRLVRYWTLVAGLLVCALVCYCMLIAL